MGPQKTTVIYLQLTEDNFNILVSLQLASNSLQSPVPFGRPDEDSFGLYMPKIL